MNLISEGNVENKGIQKYASTDYIQPSPEEDIEIHGGYFQGDIIPNPLNHEQQQESVSDLIVNMTTDELLVYGSQHILKLFVPVSVCMVLVVMVAKSIQYFSSTNVYFPYTPFHSDDATVGTLIWESLANAGIFICLVVLMTVFLVLLFKYECYRFIHGWLLFTTATVLFLISYIFLSEVIRAFHIFVDRISFIVVMWNFGVVGLFVIHWNGPLLLQQAYLVLISAEIALFLLKYLPPWTCWVLLGVLAVWDLIAVLMPKGPLRVLVEMAEKRDKPLFPALIYSTTAMLMVKSNAVESSAAQQPSQQSQIEIQFASTSSGTPMQNLTIEENSASVGHCRNLRDIQAEVISREDRGVKLGLGDFVFYSLLMGRAALDGDANTIVACYVAILIGMCLTIFLLAMVGKALPALPISIFFGIMFYIVTAFVISPFTDLLNAHQMFL